MSFHVRFTEEAQADIERLYDFPLDRDPPDFAAAERTLTAIAHAITLLEHSPWSCRKAHAGTPLLRELLIGFGQSGRSEEHTSELQSLMRISYAVFCLKQKKHNQHTEYLEPPK